MPEAPDSKQPQRGPKTSRGLFFWLILTLGLAYLIYSAPAGGFGTVKEIAYGEYYSMLQHNRETRMVISAIETERTIRGELADGTGYFVYLPANDPTLVDLLKKQVDLYQVKPPRAFWIHLYSFGPILLFIAFLYFFVYRGPQGGGKLLSFGKSRAREVSSDKNPITFEHVAGVEEAKEELSEIIDFLKDPKKFQKLGGKIPKGVLLMGPPGTGKTLLAKAVSGEAGVPFFSISGSDFVEMFVGVGASRVRDLFEQAKRSAKAGGKGAIIFIDEIDAVGRQRFAGIGGGHDEREQTLNALLVEMDGFGTEEGIILMAATNRPDVLDPALLRPGRFDRQVVIDRPDILGREKILEVHVKEVVLADDVDLKSIARQTPGFSGADLANLANEAALLAARRNKDSVGKSELEEAIERVMAGPERKSKVISQHEKEIVAHHEAGHALVALLVPHADPLHKISIIPRGTAALGYTMQLPLEDRHLMSRTELLARLTVLMGGRASEQIIFDEITTGAQNDIEVVTEGARRMVTQFGMSERLGTIALGKRDSHVFLGRDLLDERNYSEKTAELIDEEVRRIVDGAFEKAKHLLTENVDKLKLLAKELLEREILDSEEVNRLLGFANKQEPAPDPAT